jgi:hypothetical protein
VIPCSYLRIFRPLETFSDEERTQWERYIVSGGPPPAGRPVYREAAMSDSRRTGLLAVADSAHAEIRLVEGRYYVCPWHTRLRVLASIVSFRESVADEVADAFVPEAEARRAARELARLRRREPSAAPSMLQSPWHVPIRWFLLVDDDERHLVEDTPGEYRLYYWTEVGLARRRAERALNVLRRSDLAPLAKLIRDLAEWLGSFHPRCMVELDYASVSSLFSWDDLDNDHSGREIQRAIAALSVKGSMSEAAELYQTVAGRWAEARSRESLN